MRLVEELTPIKLFTDKQGYVTFVKTQMSMEEAEEIIICLRKNADVFAFTTDDLIGLDPEIALHYLNIDPLARPIKQKLRQFSLKKTK